MRALIIASLLFSVWTAPAQYPRGTITGQVTDSSGALTAGATLRATHSETGTKVSTTSNVQGTYEIPFLPPGTCKVETELAGFKTWTRSAVEVRMEDRIQVEVQLELGAVGQSIEVTAEAPLLEATKDSDRGDEWRPHVVAINTGWCSGEGGHAGETQIALVRHPTHFS